jgi:hypothetical protein
VSILCGNPEVTRLLKMKAGGRDPVTVGGIDCRLVHYTVLPTLQGNNNIKQVWSRRSLFSD